MNPAHSHELLCPADGCLRRRDFLFASSLGFVIIQNAPSIRKPCKCPADVFASISIGGLFLFSSTTIRDNVIRMWTGLDSLHEL